MTTPNRFPSQLRMRLYAGGGGVSPYLLPDGNVQIAFSGGRTSGYMLHEILEANAGLRDGVEVTFQNTGREMPQTLDFVAEVGQRWGVGITSTGSLTTAKPAKLPSMEVDASV